MPEPELQTQAMAQLRLAARESAAFFFARGGHAAGDDSGVCACGKSQVGVECAEVCSGGARPEGLRTFTHMGIFVEFLGHPPGVSRPVPVFILVVARFLLRRVRARRAMPCADIMTL